MRQEGITNVFQRKSVIDKIRKTIVNRYGDEDPLSKKRIRGKRSFSSLHKKVTQALLDRGVTLRIEKRFISDNSTYSFDIFVKPNKLIEINGDFFHANPNRYVASDIIFKGSKKSYTAAEKWEQDKKKIDFAEKEGYNVLVVWESDLNENFDQVIENIQKFIGTNNEDLENQINSEA